MDTIFPKKNGKKLGKKQKFLKRGKVPKNRSITLWKCFRIRPARFIWDTYAIMLRAM